MAANGNSGNSTGQSAASAQAAAAAGNAAASNAANGNTGTGTGNTSNTSGTSGDGKGNTGSTNTSTSNTSTGATNSAGLMGSLIGFGNSVAKGEVGNNSSGSTSGNNTETSNEAANNRSITRTYAEAVKNGSMSLTDAAVDAANKAYTKARSEGKTEKAAQKAAQAAAAKAYYSVAQPSEWSVGFLSNIKGKNTGPTYDPSITAQANTNKTIAKGSSEMGPSTPATTVTAPAANNAPGGNLGGETDGIVSGAAPTNTSDAANTGITNRGGTVTNGGGTSVTDSGTGGSISSSITPPSRDASSIGLGVYNTDRANYDQDNWNRGMEAESSSLVSDEECKAFAKRAFLENSEPFKRVRLTIIKKC